MFSKYIIIVTPHSSAIRYEQLASRTRRTRVRPGLRRWFLPIPPRNKGIIKIPALETRQALKNSDEINSVQGYASTGPCR